MRFIHLRGFYQEEGEAVTRADGPGPIETLPRGRAGIERRHGYFHDFEGRIRSAVFVVDDALFLQLGQERWDWSADRVRIKHRRGGWGRALKDSAAVFVNGERRFAATYAPSIAEGIRFGDMSIDAVDDETSNWWLWLARVVSDKEGREALLSCWRAGI